MSRLFRAKDYIAGGLCFLSLTLAAANQPIAAAGVLFLVIIFVAFIWETWPEKAASASPDKGK